jgi:UDP-N-acetylmuramate: L-alanyl-gamma-D-glutamyl-meso-diaminopimelate ligase
VLDQLGLGADEIAAGLAAFQGVRRRQEVRGTVAGVTVIDDFAHHPTAVRETLAALAARYRGRRLVAVFEPRTNSSRRRVFQQDYLSSFDDAQRILIKEPDPLKNLAPELLFSSAELAAGLIERGATAQAFPDTDSILLELADSLQPGDVVVVLSNGGFDNIHSRLLDALVGRSGSA